MRVPFLKTGMMMKKKITIGNYGDNAAANDSSGGDNDDESGGGGGPGGGGGGFEPVDDYNGDEADDEADIDDRC